MVKINHHKREIKPQIVKSIKRDAPIHLKEERKVEKVQKIKRSQEKETSRYMLWFVALVSVIFFLFALSYLFSKVFIEIDPKQKDLVIKETFSALKDGDDSSLPFDIVVISGEESTTVEVSEEKDVLEKAEGTVLLYNNFSSSPQNLTIDTRLEGTNGKIYKTKTKTIIPGMKANVPGSVEVEIYGIESGPAYNSKPLDFTIFGFKGTPKYSKFYGRSNGSITGGLVGKFPFISDDKKLDLVNKMKASLKDKLFQKAKDQTPEGFILFKDAVFLNTEENVIDVSLNKNNILPVKLKGTLYGILLNEEKLTKNIAEKNTDGYKGSPVFIPNIRNLAFSINGATDIENKDNSFFENLKNINFNLSGDAKLVWKIDSDKFIDEVLGKSKENFNQILLKYPSIDRAELSIRPFWKGSLSEEKEKIEVKVNYPSQ